MGQNNSIAAESLPTLEHCINDINNTIKTNQHNKGKFSINLDYSSRNLGYPTYDIKRKTIDHKIKEYLSDNYICHYNLSEDNRYNRVINIKNIACYCDNCVNKYKTMFL